jgi:hypothetical protein
MYSSKQIWDCIMKLPCHVVIIVLFTQLTLSCITVLPDQDAHVRTVSQVDETGRRAVEKYADKGLAEQGVLDVTMAPYYADPTGEQDATSTLQQAIRDARDARLITFLPAGRYRVSGTLTGIQGTVDWDNWPYEGFADPWVRYASFEYPCVLMGPAEGGRAVLVLDDNAVGFDEPENPKPVIHLWSRMEYGGIDKSKPQTSINFNQKIVDIDIELGDDNPGAVGIDHQGAEGSVIEDVNIDASGSFAGIWKALGSGGAIHGVTVTGGRYGFYIRNPERHRGSQPSPVVSTVRLLGQTENAILYDGRGPLTIVGALIEGAGIKSDCPESMTHYGALNIIDAVITMHQDIPAVISNHSVVLNNVYVQNARTAVQIKEEWSLSGKEDGWIHIEEYVAPATNKAHELAGGKLRRDDLWIDGVKRGEPIVAMSYEAPKAPEELVSRHDWQKPFPSRLSPGAVNVREAPYNAVGDGVADDYDALQRAIDEHNTVFVPKGIYALSKPLFLHAGTRLIGIGNVQTVITAQEGAESFGDPDNPQPLIETVDDPQAETVLAFMKLLVPVRNPCVYALRWRAGRNSNVRNVYPIREKWHPHSTAMGHPMVRIEGSGGGRWYTTVLLHWWEQGPDYRHLLVKGTREPLAFYMLEPQHSRGTTMVELNDAENVNIYAVKSEGDYGVLTMRNSRNIRLYGYAGNGAPKSGWSAFSVENCRDFQFANINPQYKPLGGYGALGTAHHPAGWNILSEISGKTAVEIPGTEQFTLYKRGNPQPVR